MSEVGHLNQVSSALVPPLAKGLEGRNEFDGKSRTVCSNSKRGQGDGPQNAPFQDGSISSQSVDKGNAS
jgi:hypothetical protein